MRFQQATRETDFYGFLWPKNDGTDDDAEYYFSTEEEAKSKLAELKAYASSSRAKEK